MTTTIQAIRCEAKPYAIGDWLIVKLPTEASKKLPSRGQVMVKGTVNGHPFQDALEPDGNWSHWLHVDANMQKSTGIGAGDTLTLEIEPTKEWPEPRIPSDIQTALDADAQAREQWSDITPMARWEWIRWINATNQSATRAKRIVVSCSKLRAGSRRPCCFNRNMCCVPEVSKSGVLLGPTPA